MENDKTLHSIKRVISSAFVVLLAYICVVLSYQYATGGLLMFWGYHPDITFNALNDLPLNYTYWSRARITVIFGGGTIWMIVQGILAWWGFFSYPSGKTSVLRYWLLWFGLLSFNYALVQLITLAAGEFDMKWSLYQGPAMVASWWRIPSVISMPIGFVFAAVSLALGYLFCPFLLRFIPSSKAGANSKSRNKFLLANYVLPVLMIGPLIFLILTPYSWVLHIALVANLLFISIGIFLRSEYIQIGVKAHRKDVLNRWPIALIVIVLVVYTTIGLYFR